MPRALKISSIVLLPGGGGGANAAKAQQRCIRACDGKRVCHHVSTQHCGKELSVVPPDHNAKLGPAEGDGNRPFMSSTAAAELDALSSGPEGAGVPSATPSSVAAMGTHAPSNRGFIFFFLNKFNWEERMANRLKTVDDLVSELNSNGVSKVIRAQLRPHPALLKKSKGSSCEKSLTYRMTQDPEMIPDGKGDDGHRKYALVFSDERWCVRRCPCRWGQLLACHHARTLIKLCATHAQAIQNSAREGPVRSAGICCVRRTVAIRH